MNVPIRSRKIINSIAVLRLLADPVKLRIYEALLAAPTSPHGLALRFGLKPTALYHHFDKLGAAKLIEVAERRQRRGVTERLYRPTAKQLVVDRRLLRTTRGSRSVKAVLAVASAILQVTAEDIRAAAAGPTRPLADRDRSEVAMVLVRTTPARARQLMRKLRALLGTATRFNGSGRTAVRLTLALVPVHQAKR
ncbi:MAG TPA: winged helix-turn-helix domain-containing protein [Kofleriaceae bacterium]|nr:winged helix-turn-helix domain-containing protein [Kofleriaceae bacterium]